MAFFKLVNIDPNLLPKFEFLSFSDVEIAKLERRKARYLERSPSPSSSAASGSSESPSRVTSPTLPLPSVAPHLNALPESNDKLLYMSTIGLNRVPEKEREVNEALFDFILDDRLSRKTRSTTLTYLTRLREMSKRNGCKKGLDEAFLSPAVMKMQRCSPLTINFSTLTPLPRHEATPSLSSSSPEMPPISVVAPAKNKKKTKKFNKRVPIVPWPGIEAVIESYKNFLRDCNDEKSVLCSRSQELQVDLATKRTKVDALSGQMAALVRRQTAASESLAKNEAKLKRASKIMNWLTSE